MTKPLLIGYRKYGKKRGGSQIAIPWRHQFELW